MVGDTWQTACVQTSHHCHVQRRLFCRANKHLAARLSLSCSEASSLSLSSPLPTVNSSSSLGVWFMTIEEASSNLSDDDWPSTESSLSMISPLPELSSKSDQLVPLSQRLMLHPVAFLQLLFRFFWDLMPICN